jgi:hypothetical protein
MFTPRQKSIAKYVVTSHVAYAIYALGASLAIAWLGYQISLFNLHLVNQGVLPQISPPRLNADILDGFTYLMFEIVSCAILFLIIWAFIHGTRMDYHYVRRNQATSIFTTYIAYTIYWSMGILGTIWILYQLVCFNVYLLKSGILPRMPRSSTNRAPPPIEMEGSLYLLIEILIGLVGYIVIMWCGSCIMDDADRLRDINAKYDIYDTDAVSKK